MQSGPTTDNRGITKQKAIFARHETFHPRYGWLKKAYDAVKKDSTIFYQEDASVVLGVGKNMVKAIKYWALAFKIIVENPKLGHSPNAIKITEFATALLDDDGWDPYLEDPASLWLLHWELLRPPCLATAWWFTFNEFHKTLFSQDDLLFAIKNYVHTTHYSSVLKDSSIAKDINCLLRMYIGHANKEKIREESIDSPFTELSVLRHDGDTRHFAFNLGRKHDLSPNIIVSTCLDYAQNNQKAIGTISLSRLLHDHNSPGLVLKLTESALCDAIDVVSRDCSEISMTESGGLLQFNFHGEPSNIKSKMFRQYYEKN